MLKITRIQAKRLNFAGIDIKNLATTRPRPATLKFRMRPLTAGLAGIAAIFATLTTLPHTVPSIFRPNAINIVHRTRKAAEVGINLSGVMYYDASAPFIDRMKTSSTWASWAAGSRGTTIQLDANGYPDALPAGQKGLQVLVALDPSTAGTSHRYVLSYDGNARVSLQDATIVSIRNGKIVFDYFGSRGRAQLAFTYDSPVPKLARKITLVREDQVDLFNKGEIFNPAFISKLSSFSELRFMDWGNTNGSTVVNWEDRTKVSDLSWAPNSKMDSVPLEIMVALANETGKEMWYNIPAHASDDFIKRALTYIRDNLDSGIKVHLEYSNEVWNGGFEQSKYAATMATALWGDVTDGAQQYYGYRSAQIAAAAQATFGSSAAVRVDAVLAVQTAYAGREKNIFSGIARANVGTISGLFNEYAVTTYFGGQLGGGTEEDRATVVSWAQSGAVGLDKAFKELRDGGSLSSNQSLKTILGWLTYQHAVAEANGLSMVTYEGGVDLTAMRYDAAQQPIVLDLFKRLVADPRMGDLYLQMIGGFSAAGGDLFTAFNEVGVTSVWGSYGALEHIYQDSSIRFDALVKAAQLGNLVSAGSSDIFHENGTTQNDTLGSVPN